MAGMNLKHNKMKRKITCAFCACMCIATLCGFAGKRKVNIVFIGNSITYGAEIDHATQAPPVRVAERLKAGGYDADFRNCGVSGSVTSDWLPSRNTWMFKRMVEAADALAVREGALVFSIMLGTNDSSIECRVSPADYYDNMRQIVDYILGRYPKAQVIVNYPIWYSTHTYNSARYLHEGQERLKSYLPIIDRLCKDYHLEGSKRVQNGSRKTFGYFENRTDLFVAENSSLGQGLKFYLHPNPEGAARLARFWTKSIKKAAKSY